VTSFTIIGQFVIKLTFDDGLEKSIDFQPVLKGPIYSVLRDPIFFNKVRIDPDAKTLVWPNGADFDPSTLHDWDNCVEQLSQLIDSSIEKGYLKVAEDGLTYGK
jgi:hypothetical protein